MFLQIKKFIDKINLEYKRYTLIFVKIFDMKKKYPKQSGKFSIGNLIFAIVLFYLLVYHT